MSERSAMFLVVVGLVLALGGAGGIEESVSNADLLGSAVLALTGALIMWCGTLGLRNKHFG